MGGQRRLVSRVRSKIAYRLNRELGISMAEIDPEANRWYLFFCHVQWQDLRNS